MKSLTSHETQRHEAEKNKLSGHTISSAWVKGIAEMLDAAGMDVSDLFTRAGLDEQALKDPHARYASERVNTLWELAATASGNPAIGLARPEIAKPAIFDIVAFAMMSCENLLAGLERLSSYLRVVSNAATLKLDKQPDGYWMKLDVFDGSQIVPRHRFEFDLITLLTFCRWITRHDLRPLMVSFTHPLPADAAPYTDAFRSPVQFDALANGMLFAHDDLVLPLPTHNPLLVALHDKYIGEYLDRLADAGTSQKVRELIVRRLPDGDPLRGDIANALCMSERTLQRRLHDEGTSFHQLVDDTRRNLAHQYLGRNRLSLDQTAYLLGFTDQSTFCRACRRWFSMSPGQYRTSLSRDARGIAA